MRRDQLRLLILEARRITHADEILVIGSQSVLATWDEDELPEDTTRSTEADMLVRVAHGIRLTDEQADLVSQLLERSGMLSEFDQLHGIHIDSISPNTALLAPGWEERLVEFPVTTDDDVKIIGLCLDPYDACASKLVAFREHDREFVGSLIRAGLIDPQKLQNRLEDYGTDYEINHVFVFVQSFLPGP